MIFKFSFQYAIQLSLKYHRIMSYQNEASVIFRFDRFDGFDRFDRFKIENAHKKCYNSKSSNAMAFNYRTDGSPAQ